MSLATHIYIDPLNEYSPSSITIDQSTQIVDKNGATLDYVFKDFFRTWTALDEIDPKLVALVLFAEDDKFYEHSGLDFLEIAESIKKNISKKKFARGGSTITQQLAKNVFLTHKKQ